MGGAAQCTSLNTVLERVAHPGGHEGLETVGVAGRVTDAADWPIAPAER